MVRFSAVATGSVALLAISGSVIALRQTGSWRALTDTDFGQTLIVKLLLAVALAGVAANTRWILIPPIKLRPTRSAPSLAVVRRAVRIEQVVLIVVVGVNSWREGVGVSRIRP